MLHKRISSTKGRRFEKPITCSFYETTTFIFSHDTQKIPTGYHKKWFWNKIPCTALMLGKESPWPTASKLALLINERSFVEFFIYKGIQTCLVNEWRSFVEFFVHEGIQTRLLMNEEVCRVLYQQGPAGLRCEWMKKFCTVFFIQKGIPSSIHK